ncbi:endonuclease domain-containing protein [Streptomyces mirabilis]|uniref:endonuclease domain-containing protein n=1 Tax=Streptomyces mirabilis TaxID=68239 RepID=UPI003691E8C3
MHIRRKPKHESGIKCQAHKGYLLTCEEYEALWARSGGACEACGFQPETREYGLVIDHDHKYGKTAVRGLICRWCNTALGKLENPDVNPAFGPGPGSWFGSYFRRAWFVRTPDPQTDVTVLIDRSQLDSEIKRWRSYNKALFSTNPRTALVPLDKPSVTVEILREQMSPQAFGVLVRTVNKLAESAATNGADPQ